MIDKLFDKPIITDTYGNLIIDMFEPSYTGIIENVPYRKVGYVNSLMEMRVDIFAEIYGYGDDEIVNILKYNRIQNPFSIKEGDTLAIPQDSSMQDIKITPEKRNVLAKDGKIDNMRKTFYDAMTPFIKTSPTNNTFDSFKKKYENLAEQKRMDEFKNLQGDTPDKTSLFPPNVADLDKKEIKVNSNGTITMGTSVADTPSSCGIKTLTKAELLNSLIKNRR